MEPNALNFDDVDELTDLLKGSGIRSVDVDPAKVNTPGIWVRLDGVELDTLAGCTIRLTLHLVVANTDPRRDMTALAEMFNQVVPLLRPLGGPTGPTQKVGLVLPGSTTPLPALAVPLDLLTTQETP